MSPFSSYLLEPEQFRHSPIYTIFQTQVGSFPCTQGRCSSLPHRSLQRASIIKSGPNEGKKTLFEGKKTNPGTQLVPPRPEMPVQRRTRISPERPVRVWTEPVPGGRLSNSPRHAPPARRAEGRRAVCGDYSFNKGPCIFQRLQN